jgi:hypothetical protein
LKDTPSVIVSESGTIFNTRDPRERDFYFETTCKTKTDIGIMWTIRIRSKKDKQ